MTTSPWRIVFFGTPAFALPTLQTLFERPDEVIAVVTQPDREKGRGRRVVFSPVKEQALRHHLLLLQPERVREELFRETLIELHPNLIVVVAFGQILPKSILNIPQYGAINVHASLLPRYRGAAPIAWAILNGEKVTGITTMVMDEGMDTGDILLQVETPIGNEETCETLHDRLASLGAQLLKETLEKMKAVNIHPIPQDHSKATYAPPLKKEDGHIDWKRGANEINRHVRAFNPWPGAFTKLGDQWLKIYKGEIRERPLTGKAGAVVWVGSDFIDVETGKDSFRIKEVQLEGGRRMTIRDFLSGHPIPVGAAFH
ncbi:MAG: methionyl-tRNA formyltransferase [Deltaproteobacteria bacterium RBG_19FT_COMBO_46_12]|nr:MAG: methionyl-tRNA formyltransferase [Deltaproteobacteria bacterium RBG_19FT_COMBO_46_12]